jgi:type II secretory pathway component GspD/PulD (secretin)
MFARKVMVSMVAMAVGLTGLGIVFAGDPPSQPPAMQEVNGLINTRQEVIEKQIKQSARNLDSGEKQLLIEAVIVEMPAKFCAECGLTEDAPKRDEKSALLVTCLNPREVKMLHSLIRINPAREVFSRPILTIRDGETGTLQVGADYSVLTDFPKSQAEAGKTRSVTMIPIGMALTLTPKINSDNGDILLRIETRVSQVSDHVTAPETPFGPRDPSLSDKNFLEQNYKKEFDAGAGLPKGSTGIQTSPSINTRSVQTSVIIPPGGTVVIGNKRATGTNQTELLWILTTHVTTGKK